MPSLSRALHRNHTQNHALSNQCILLRACSTSGTVLSRFWHMFSVFGHFRALRKHSCAYHSNSLSAGCWGITEQFSELCQSTSWRQTPSYNCLVILFYFWRTVSNNIARNLVPAVYSAERLPTFLITPSVCIFA